MSSLSFYYNFAIFVSLPMFKMDIINLQIGFIVERCRRIKLLFGVISPIITLIKKDVAELIMNTVFLLCTILIPVMLLFIIGNILLFLF